MHSMMISSKLRIASLFSVFATVVAGSLAWYSMGALECPAGYEARDPAMVAHGYTGRMSVAYREFLHERFGKEFCIRKNLPESMMEAHNLDQSGRLGQTGALLRRAVQQKAAMQPLQSKIDGAAGQWVNYGVGPQLSLPEYNDGSRDGIPEAAGRADSFAYDSAARRLFVAITYGGIWMSEAVNGDVSTLGNNWVSIGDTLPTQINSAVAWTPAGGGRVIALSGEHVQGGNTYVGLGASWSDDLGQTWNQSTGLPDGAGGSKLAVDLSNPSIVYAATHQGLFRSDDAGVSFVNVNLPVSPDCAGVAADVGPCQLANVVSDVVIRQPGGIDATTLQLLSDNTCGLNGCPVLAAIGYRAGGIPVYNDGTPQSPGNGLYRSDTGEPDTFAKIDPQGPAEPVAGGLVPVGFAPQNRIGRVELGAAEGPEQDHNYVYAIVEDALLFNNGLPILDLPLETKNPSIPLDCSTLPDGDPRFICEIVTGGFSPTSFNGIYVSPDFGTTWIKLADDVEITYNLTTGSSLTAVAALGVGPGAQAWYNQWIKPDPTQAVLSVPTRVVFGLEEIWKNNLIVPVTGLEQTPNDFGVIGTYFAGETCLFLLGTIGPALPVCPVYDGIINGTTTHPDQHDGIFIPDPDRGGVWLIVGNDGGVYKQYSANPITDDFANNKWGNGANKGFFTLFNYGIAAAKDGTIWYGLQDNASGKIEPTGRHVRTYVGDGIWTAVDPDNSNIAYVQTPGLSLNRTTDGGFTHTNIAPDAAVGVAHFLSPFVMDPLDADHLVASGTLVAENLAASSSGDWATVFDLSQDAPEGALNPQTRSRALEVRGDAIYAGWCGPCQPLNGIFPGGTLQFQRGLATNVGGAEPREAGTPSGWHQASLNGLPNRYIHDIEIDDVDAKTVYVVLGDYSTARWLKTGQHEDTNSNIGAGHVFVSKDAGETFTDISGNLPDIITTAILKRGNQLIVGTDIGVFISSDLSGSQWAPLGNLPSVPVNQLVLLPGDDNFLFAGTFGRGVQLYSFDGKALNAKLAASKEGRGLLIGAFAPWLLMLVGFGAVLRRARCLH